MTSSYNLVVESLGCDDQLDLVKGEIIVKGHSQVSGTGWIMGQFLK